MGACVTLESSPCSVVGILYACDGSGSSCCGVEDRRPRSRVAETTHFVCLGRASFGNVCEIGLGKRCGIPCKFERGRFLGRGALLSMDGTLRGTVLECKSFSLMERGVGPGSLIFLSPPCAISRGGGKFVGCGRGVFSLRSRVELGSLVRCVGGVKTCCVLAGTTRRAVGRVFGGKS